MLNLKIFLKRVLPSSVLELYHSTAHFYKNRLTALNDPKKVFSHIYRHNIWGQKKGFFSGKGSHDPAIVTPYVENISTWLKSFDKKPSIVDLGCGDFTVGRHFVDLASTYLGCDIVKDLITHHNRTYKTANLSFQELDIIKDPLPDGDMAFIRQVLQHLDNDQISSVVPKLSKYKYLVLTEHLPNGKFTPNKDKAVGPDIRTKFQSGVVLTAPPFNLKPKSSKILCEVVLPRGNIQTILYEF